MQKTKISLSVVASFFLAQSLSAADLPSGGKFLNQNGGSIKVNGVEMNIAGKDNHNVIAWGGGFNIAQGYKVKFTTQNKNYLNLDYTKNPSKIAGELNGGNNKIFLVNPSGILIEGAGVIKASEFVASTNPINETAIKNFKNNGSISPVIANARGDIINLGHIKASKVKLVGRKIEALHSNSYIGNKDKGASNDTYAENIEIMGKEVYINGDILSGKNVKIQTDKSGTEGSFTQHTKNYNDRISNINYTFDGNFQKYLLIGSVDDWNSFANGWNNNKNFRDKSKQFDEFRLSGNINFNNQSFTGKSAGNSTNAFSGIFNGNGYTLNNIGSGNYNGIFERVNGGTIKNVNVDYNNATIAVNGSGGGFVGVVNGSSERFENITISGLKSISGTQVGGFGGQVMTGTYKNIKVNTIGTISGVTNAGGFAANIGGVIENVQLSDIQNVKATMGSAGGFAGAISGGRQNAIALTNIGTITGTNAGGYVGNIMAMGGATTISEILLDGVTKIVGGTTQAAGNAGGFVGSDLNGAGYNKITLKNVGNIESTNEVGGFAGNLTAGTFNHIRVELNGNIYGAKNTATYGRDDTGGAGGFAGAIGAANLQNIVVKGISSISYDTSSKKFFYTGGFAGSLNQTTLSNIYVHFKENAKVEGKTDNGRGGTGSFYGFESGKANKNNVFIYHKTNSLSSIMNQESGITHNSFTNQSQVNSEFDNAAKNIYGGNGFSNFAITLVSINQPKNQGSLDSVTLTLSDFTESVQQNGNAVESIFNEIINGKFTIYLGDSKVIEVAYTDTNGKQKKIKISADDFAKLGDSNSTLSADQEAFLQALDFVLKFDNDLYVKYSGNKQGNGDISLNTIAQNIKDNQTKLKAYLQHLENEGVAQALESLKNQNSNFANEKDAYEKIVEAFEKAKQEYQKTIKEYNQAIAEYDSAVKHYNDEVAKYNAEAVKGSGEDVLKPLEQNYKNAEKAYLALRAKYEELKVKMEEAKKPFDTAFGEANADFAALEALYQQMEKAKEDLRLDLKGLKLYQEYYTFQTGDGTFTFVDGTWDNHTNSIVNDNIIAKMEANFANGMGVNGVNLNPDTPPSIGPQETPTTEIKTPQPSKPDPNPTPKPDPEPTPTPDPIPEPKPEPEPTPEPTPAPDSAPETEMQPDSKPELEVEAQPSLVLDSAVETKSGLALEINDDKYQEGLAQPDGVYSDGEKKKVVCVVSTSANTHNPCLSE